MFRSSFLPKQSVAVKIGTGKVHILSYYTSTGAEMHYGHSAINDKRSGGKGADFFSGGLSNDVLTDFNAAQGDTKDNTIP